MPKPARSPADPAPSSEALALLTLDEVAALLRVSVSTIRRRVDAGELPAPVRVGRALRWPRVRLLAFLGLSNE